MKMNPFILLCLTLCTRVLHAEPARADDPLVAPAVVLCLRPLTLMPRPVLADAVETVKRLTAFAQTQEGMSKRAVEALIFIIRDLFQKEHELVAAQKDLAQVEMKAAAKERLADKTETVGSPLSGPNPRLAKMYRSEATELLH